VSTIVTTFTYTNYLFYIVISMLCLVLLIRMNKEFKPKDLVGSFISLTNVIVLFVLFVSFLLAFVFEFLDVSGVDVLGFITQVINIVLYFCLIGYGTYYVIKLFAWMRNFVKENDLMYLSYFEKKAEIKVKRK